MSVGRRGFAFVFVVGLALVGCVLGVPRSGTRASASGCVVSQSAAQGDNFPVVCATNPDGSSNAHVFKAEVNFVVVCTPTNRINSDPIVMPGSANEGMFMHEHTFVGQTGSATSTVASLKAQPTNCGISANHSLYWTPTLYKADGTPMVPYASRLYYRTGTIHPENLIPIPVGLEMIAGDKMATATTLQSPNVAGIYCRWISGSAANTDKQPFPPGANGSPVCPEGTIIAQSVEFPNCWNGVIKYAPENFAYSSGDGDCPAGMNNIPKLTQEDRYDADGHHVGEVGMYYAAMNSPFTLHADALEAWDQATFDRLFTDCLRAGIHCGDVSDKRMPPPSGLGPPLVAAGSTTAAPSGAPANASAVLTNLAMTDAAAAGYITADKCSMLHNGPQTNSNGNYVAGAAISNLSVVPIDPDGRFCIYNQTRLQLVADVQGYFAPPGTGGQEFTSMQPTRQLDTRSGGAAPVAAGSITRVSANAPAGASAALVNVAMTDATAAGYITADKCSVLQAGPQTRSNGNYVAGAAISNLSVVPVDADGSFCIYNHAPVHLVVDIQGSFGAPSTAGMGFTQTSSVRKLDSRDGGAAPKPAGSITRVSTGAVAGTKAVLVNVAMTDATAAGYVTADKCSVLQSGPQTKSNGNFVVGAAISNLSVVPIDSDGSFCIYNHAPVHLVVDLQGSFATSGSSQFFPMTQARILDTRIA